MRIIAGSARGRKLSCPPGDRTRPLLDRIREALFSILAERVVDAEVLDLYAGTGSIGLEALSRGAARCTFVERGSGALKCLRRNVEDLGFALRARIHKGEVRAFLADLDGRFDLIFYDPPYADLRAGRARGRVIDMAATLFANSLGPAGALVFHYPRNFLDPGEISRIGPASERHYGTSTLAIFEMPASP